VTGAFLEPADVDNLGTRSALSQVPLQFAADVRRHIAVHIVAERGPDLFAAKHWRPLLFEG
jgi:hypothetical protein